MGDTLTTTERIKNWLDILSEEGYRLTAPRKAVVEVVAAADHAVNPTEIYDLARQNYGRLGLVTVYRTIEKLEELHLVQRVHRPDDCQAFIAKRPGHQHLLVCDDCGRVTHFSGDELGLLITEVQQDTGFEITEHWLQFFGLCKNCAGHPA
jgi:Fe2+ or Zn2+ uptake regulation protein